MDKPNIHFYILEQYDRRADAAIVYSVPAANIQLVMTKEGQTDAGERKLLFYVQLKHEDNLLYFDPLAADGEQLLKDYGLIPSRDMQDRLAARRARRLAIKQLTALDPNTPRDLREITGEDLSRDRLGYLKELGFDDAESTS